MNTAVDVMGFAGGFTLGMCESGFKIAGKRELPGGFGIPSCEANRHLLGYDWEAQACDPRDWEVIKDASVVFGNPPCSGFSLMTTKSFRGADSPINEHMRDFVRYAARVNPPIAIFESVQVAITRTDGRELMRSLRALMDELTGTHWTLYHVKHNALSLGGPAMRKRYFWVVSRIPFGIEVPRLRRTPTYWDVIGDLADMNCRMGYQTYRSMPSWWAQSRVSPRGIVDGQTTVSTPLSVRIRELLEKVEWNQGEAIAVVAKRYYDRYGHLPQSWAPFEQKIVSRDFNMGYTTPIRWCADRPGRVVTGGTILSVVHPTKNRLITYREGARLMGFPDDWLISPLSNLPGLACTFGKGITVDCGRWIGSWALEALNGNPGAYRGVKTGDDEYDIDVTYAYKRVV